jgi:hypothetical protein
MLHRPPYLPARPQWKHTIVPDPPRDAGKSTPSRRDYRVQSLASATRASAGAGVQCRALEGYGIFAVMKEVTGSRNGTGHKNDLVVAAYKKGANVVADLLNGYRGPEA